MKVRIFKEHDDFVPAVKEIAAKKGNDFVFVNVDSHSDMGVSDKDIDIGNFINHLISVDCFSKVLWVKNDHNDDFEDGVFNFKVGETNDGEIASSLENIFYFADGTFSREEEFLMGDNSTVKDVTLEVLSETKMDKSVFLNKKWLLSIDCNFFSSANPLSKEKANLKRIFKEGFLEKIENDLNNVKSYEDWISFKKELIISKNWNTVYNFLSFDHPEYECSEEEIESKVKKLIAFLKKNFRLEDCLGILICTSFFSGYVNKKKCPKIVSILETYMNNLNFFWEKA